MPKEDQQEAYNRHKRLQAIKFQIVAMLDGLLFCSTPFEGHRHNSHMLLETMVCNWAEEHAKGVDGTPKYLYGDQAYHVSPAVISPWKGNFIDRLEE